MIKKDNRVVAVHLLNNFTGSPYVCKMVIETLNHFGCNICLYTATPDGSGFLSNLPNVSSHSVFYKWSPNKWATLVFYLYSQLSLFFKLIVKLKSTDLVYISTLLPAGAALAARIKGCKVIYHIHEDMVSPPILHKVLYKIVRLTANKACFVSEFTSRAYVGGNFKRAVIYNCLGQQFFEQAMKLPSAESESFTILMICSKKAYKGIYVFVELARAMPQFNFILTLNTSPNEAIRFSQEVNCPENCQILATVENTLLLFKQAHVVLNLSLPHLFRETFGLTLLEALNCGRPVIAPPVGGPIEYINHGKNGFLVDAREPAKIQEYLELMSKNSELYAEMAQNARNTAQRFTFPHFANNINDFFLKQP